MVPASRLDEEAGDVGPVGRSLTNQVNVILVGDRLLLTCCFLFLATGLVLPLHIFLTLRAQWYCEEEFELQEINGSLVLSRVVLENTRHKSMREEEPREPEGLWMPLHHPLSHEPNSFMKISEP